MKLTPVLAVEKIEPSLSFWVDRMGFEKTVEVPGDDGASFVILVKGGAELMIQTAKSIEVDEPKFAFDPKSRITALFIEVDDFADILKRLEGYSMAMPQRDTFYGMREVGVFDPFGNIVIFATQL